MGNSKKLIISHVADIDGLNSVVLSKIVYPNIDYILVEFAELEEAVKNLYETNKYLEYNEIFIVDVSIRGNLPEYIFNRPNLANKIKHFDHHLTEAKDNNYYFVNEVLEEDNKPVCGTSLFYDYLIKDCKNSILLSNKVKGLVECTRCRDNWLTKEEPYEFGCDLTELSLMYGTDMYINQLTNALNNNKPLICDNEEILIQKRYEQMREYIMKCDDSLIFMNLGGRNIGVSFSEQYRSEVGNILSREYTKIIDYILIINLYRMQYSFRTTKDDINVGEIAKSFDITGGGNAKSAGLPINENTLWILQEATKKIKTSNKSNIKKINK